MLLWRSNTLALIRQRLDLDARTTHRGAPALRDISGGVMKLTVGNADKSIPPGDSQPDPYFDRARKIAQRIKEVFDLGKSKAIAAEMFPGSVLFAERARPVRAG